MPFGWMISMEIILIHDLTEHNLIYSEAANGKTEA